MQTPVGHLFETEGVFSFLFLAKLATTIISQKWINNVYIYVNLRSWAPRSSMAARQIQRRLLSLFSTKQPQTSSLYNGPSWQFLSSANSFFSGDEICRRRIQTLPQPSEPAIKDGETSEASRLRPDSDSSKCISNPPDDSNSAVKFNATSNLKVSSRHDLAMIFTCKVCETRSIKTVCRESYEKGVVVARCSGCNNLHLIADHLGWFGEPGSIEDLLAARGEEVKRSSVDSLNFTLADLAGTESKR